MAAGDPGTRKRNYSAIATETKLTNSIASASSGDTTTNVIVNSVSGFPSTVPYTLIIDPDTSKEEVVTVTAISSTTLTITRGQDNTTAVAHTANAGVRHGVSAREFKELQTHISARGVDADSALLSGVDSHVHGLVTGDGSVVGSTQSVTLTRKTLTTPTINGATISGAFTSTATITGGTVTSGTITSSTVTSSTITSGTLGSDLAAGGYKVTGLGAPTADNDATRKIYVDGILGSATAASASATASAASAATAATSAASAATYATNASNSANASATSASASATSAGASATSATASATSAGASASSAASAAISATSAANSATAAAASVASIATYATNASNSATSSATSATASASSATLSASSATASATSASASATSASASATSAGQAATSATSSASSATISATSATASATSAGQAATSASSAATNATAAAASASAAATSASDAATTYDNFDDRYLGSKTSAPTLDNDGNTLLVGAIYWNSTVNNMYVWSGSTWVQIATTSIYTAPTLGSTLIPSGTTVTTLDGVVDIIIPNGPGSIKDELTLLLMEAL